MEDSIHKGLNFIALDVETANNRLMSSICQIGLCFVQDGEITETKTYLVNPECDFTNSHIHGVTSATVVGSPTFPDALTNIRELLEGKLIVHHGHFDRKAFAAASEHFQISLPDSRYLDSAQFFREAFSRYSKKGYGLKNLCQDYRVHQASHHSAGNDAQCLSQVFMLALTEAGLNMSNIQSWRVTKGEAPGIGIVKIPSLSKPVQPNISTPLQAVRPVRTKVEVSPDNPFYLETIVFTGEFSYPRPDLIEMAVAAGLTLRSSVSRSTTYLVVGIPSKSTAAYIKPSQKSQKAEALNAQGANIKLLTEKEFFALIEREDTSKQRETSKISSANHTAADEQPNKPQQISVTPSNPDPVHWIESPPSPRSETPLHTTIPVQPKPTKTTLKQRWQSLPKKARTWIIVIAVIILLYLCGLLTGCSPQVQEVIVTRIHTKEIEVTRQITQLVIVTATPLPPTETLAPTVVPATPTASTAPQSIAKNVNLVQEQNGVRVVLNRVLIADPDSKIGLERKNNEFFRGKIVHIQPVITITNNTDQVINMSFVGDILIMANDEQVSYNQFVTYLYLPEFSKDILPGGTVRGPVWVGLNEHIWNQITKITVRIPAFQSNDNQVTDDFIFIVPVDGWDFDPLPDEW